MDRQEFSEALYDLLCHTEFHARSYSGRGMQGEHCIGVYLESTAFMADLFFQLGCASMEGVYNLSSRRVLATSVDTLGMGIIVYWRSSQWDRVNFTEHNQEPEGV